MCRLAAYVGPERPLATLLSDPPRSLEQLAIEPREQHSGRINVDGTGVAWWAGDDAVPLHYRTDRPVWADPNLPQLARRLRGRVQLAAVRSATPGVPHGAAFVHPFVAGRLAGTHNGWISGYRARVARPLMARLSDAAFGALDGMSDSAVIFLLAWDAYAAGAGLSAAARAAVDTTVEVCADADATATLTLVLADSDGVVACHAAHGRPANSLYTLWDGTRWPEAALLASEPLDGDTAWQRVQPGGLVTLTSAGIDLTDREPTP